MSCCGVCGGQKPEKTNEQDKNKEQEQTQESKQTQYQEKKSLFDSMISHIKK